MKRYMALLRGINISGKNKVVMAELKKEFDTLYAIIYCEHTTGSLPAVRGSPN